ncbi:MAG: cation:proton antiporter [Methanolobus sp.]|nr:cation:proton antiporter [Methanolobus sp.]
MDQIDIFSPQDYDIILVYLGIVILLAMTFPQFLPRHRITAPIAYLLISVCVFSFFPQSPLPHLAESPYLGKRLTELGVIISLTAAGLKLQQPFAWKTWRYATRLLIITMPLTIALTAFVGWGFLGFAPAGAMLLGAVIAPTDPVLASDTQTTPPDKDDTSARMALTTEAGLNDGLAFPFTNMAISMVLIGTHPSFWFTGWLVTDVFYKILVGALMGVVTGWLLAKIIYCCPKPQNKISTLSVGLLALSLTLLPYGLAELVSSYGFITVFVAACTFRYQETTHHHLNVLHDFSEEIERTLVVILFSILGIYISHGFLEDFQWYMVPAALFVVLIIRPLTGIIGLWGTDLNRSKKYIIAFYGIRGIGSIYYLLYAFYHADFGQSKEILALVTVVILISIFMHGLSARPVMKRWMPE